MLPRVCPIHFSAHGGGGFVSATMYSFLAAVSVHKETVWEECRETSLDGDSNTHRVIGQPRAKSEKLIMDSWAVSEEKNVT